MFYLFLFFFIENLFKQCFHLFIHLSQQYYCTLQVSSTRVQHSSTFGTYIRTYVNIQTRVHQHLDSIYLGHKHTYKITFIGVLGKLGDSDWNNIIWSTQSTCIGTYTTYAFGQFVTILRTDFTELWKFVHREQGKEYKSKKSNFVFCFHTSTSLLYSYVVHMYTYVSQNSSK